jgi:hypothetical protein
MNKSKQQAKLAKEEANLAKEQTKQTLWHYNFFTASCFFHSFISKHVLAQIRTLYYGTIAGTTT